MNKQKKILKLTLKKITANLSFFLLSLHALVIFFIALTHYLSTKNSPPTPYKCSQTQYQQNLKTIQESSKKELSWQEWRVLIKTISKSSCPWVVKEFYTEKSAKHFNYLVTKWQINNRQ